MKKLDDLRQEIDSIDSEILSLIKRRGQAVLDVGELKQQQGGDTLFYRPEREAQVLRKIIAQDTSPLDSKEVAELFRQLMSMCLALQHPIKIAFLGPLGTFSHTATLKHFGQSALLHPCTTIETVFADIENHQAYYGVVPIENSIGGVVNATIDAFIHSDLKICGELNLKVKQNLLLGKKHQNPIQRIYAHEQSLRQCQNYLAKNYPQAEQVSVHSNAYAAQMLQQDKKAAAIGNAVCAEIYSLEMIDENIQDSLDNYTRFLVIGKQIPEISGDDKTALLVTLGDKPGALERVLQLFATNQVNLNMIHSRVDVQKSGNYIFFLSIIGHADEAPLKKVIAQMQSESMSVKVLGSYPKAVTTN